MTNETICEKARRLANESRAARRAEERELVSQIIGGEAPEARADGVYEICGYEWVYWGGSYGLKCSSRYKGIILIHHLYARDIASFGDILLNADKRLAELKVEYPDNRWGNIRAWWCRL